MKRNSAENLVLCILYGGYIMLWKCCGRLISKQNVYKDKCISIILFRVWQWVADCISWKLYCHLSYVILPFKFHRVSSSWLMSMNVKFVFFPSFCILTRQIQVEIASHLFSKFYWSSVVLSYLFWTKIWIILFSLRVLQSLMHSALNIFIKL